MGDNVNSGVSAQSHLFAKGFYINTHTHDSSCKNWENVNTDPAPFFCMSWCFRSSQAALREVSGTGSRAAADSLSLQFCAGGFCLLTSPTGR